MGRGTDGLGTDTRVGVYGVKFRFGLRGVEPLNCRVVREIRNEFIVEIVSVEDADSNLCVLYFTSIRSGVNFMSWVTRLCKVLHGSPIFAVLCERRDLIHLPIKGLNCACSEGDGCSSFESCAGGWVSCLGMLLVGEGCTLSS